MTMLEIVELATFLIAIIIMTIIEVRFLKRLLKYYIDLQYEVYAIRNELERYENKFVLLESKVNKS